jgi:undecaprenyl-diphosphatase
MEVFYSAFLGIVQGLTEFLPVSSSGHLVLVQQILPTIKSPGVVFEAFLHAGTLFAILLYFRKDILKIGKNYSVFIVIGSIPAVFFGLVFSSFFESLFENTKMVGLALLVTGILNMFTDMQVLKKRALDTSNSLVIGLFQAFAIIPGISRSGSTIFAGSRLGINRQDAAKFSFLLSIPAVLGANLLEFVKYKGSFDGSYTSFLVGFLFSFVAGYFAINLVLESLKRRNFKYFAYYCFGLGLLVVFFL